MLRKHAPEEGSFDLDTQTTAESPVPHDQLAELETATTVAHKKEEVQQLKQEVQPEAEAPTREQLLENSRKQILTSLFDEKKDPRHSAQQIIIAMRASPDQKVALEKARKELVLQFDETQKINGKELLDQRTSPQALATPDKLPQNPYIQAYLVIYLVHKGIYERDQPNPLVRDPTKAHEGLVFLAQYETKKKELAAETDNHGYLIPAQLLKEQQAVIDRTPEMTDITYEATTNALLHYLESTPIVSKLSHYPLPFEHIRELISASGYHQYNQDELLTLLAYIPLRKEHTHRLPEISVTPQGSASGLLTPLPTAEEMKANPKPLSDTQEQALLQRVNTIREAQHLTPNTESLLSQTDALIDQLVVDYQPASSTPDVLLENTVEAQLATLGATVDPAQEKQLTSYNALIEKYLHYLDDHKHPDIQIMRVISQYKGSQLALLNQRALPQQEHTPGAWSNDRYIPGTLLEGFMQQTDLSMLSTDALVHEIAEPFVTYIKTDYDLSNRSNLNMDDPQPQTDKNQHLLGLQRMRYQQRFTGYDETGRFAWGNTRSRRLFGNVTTIANNTIGDGDPRADYIHPTPKAELLQAYCPSIAEELADRYIHASTATEKEHIKAAALSFVEAITDSTMIDGKTSFQQDETAFQLLLPIISDELHIPDAVAQIDKGKLLHDLGISCDFTATPEDTIMQLQTQLPTEKQAAFATLISQAFDVEQKDIALHQLHPMELIVLGSLFTAAKTHDGDQLDGPFLRMYIENNMALLQPSLEISLPDPQPKSLALFESIGARMGEHGYFDQKQYVEAGVPGRALLSKGKQLIRRILPKAKTLGKESYYRTKRIVGDFLLGSMVGRLMLAGGAVWYFSEEIKKFLEGLGLGRNKEGTGSKVQTPEEKQQVFIGPPEMAFDVILDRRTTQKTITQEIVYKIKASEGDSRVAKGTNLIKKGINNTAAFFDKNRDVIDMTVKGEIQVHCDLTDVDRTNVSQVEWTGDPKTSTIDIFPPTFDLDIHLRPEDMAEVFKVVQTKESWMSNEQERAQVINDAFVQYYLRCIGQDNTDSDTATNLEDHKQRQEDIAEMIGDAETKFRETYIRMRRSQQQGAAKNIPDENITVHFNNDRASLMQQFYERVTKNDRHRNMFPYADSEFKN